MLANDLSAAQSLLGEGAVGFKYEFDGLGEILAGLIQRGRLGVGA